MRIYKMFMRNLVNYPWIGPDVVVVVIKLGRFKFITNNYEIRPDRLLEYKPTKYYVGYDPVKVYGDISTIQHGRLDSNGNHMIMSFDPDTEFLHNMKEFNKLWDAAIHKFPKGQIRNPIIMGTEGGISKGKITMINGTSINFPTKFQYWDSGLSILDNMKQNMMSQKEFDLMIHNYPEFNEEISTVRCDHCSGSGEEDIFDLEKGCKNCNGKGWIKTNVKNNKY